MGETPPRAPSPVGGVPESLLVLDGDLCVQDASLPFYAMFGVTPEQTLGRRLRELGDGQWDVPALRELLEGLPAGDGTFDDYRVQRDFPNIGPATMLLKGRCLHKGDPTDWLILLGIRDVTDPPGAGRARAVSREALYESALAGICDAIIASDVQGRVSLLNPAAEAMTGWDRRQATGRPVAEVLRVLDERTRSPCDGPLVPAVLPDRWDGAGGHDVLVARDGTERAVERIADPIRDADGTVVGAVAVVRDVTRRRRAEAALAASEARYRRLFEAARDGILILAVDTCRITDVNPFMLELLGHRRDHFIGKELWEIGVPRDAPANRAAIDEVRRTGYVRLDALSLQGRDGRPHPVEVVANVYQEGGAAVIQCNVRDVARRVRADADRASLLAAEHAARLRAEEADRSKDLFLATLSHEVRTPLNAILGWATIIRGGGCGAADLAEGMEAIERNCTLQAQLIEDLLDVSRIVSGKLELQLVPCDLAAVVRRAIETVAPSAAAKHVRFEVDLEPHVGPARCDARRMQQAVWNLLANAVKFSDVGSAVRVTLAWRGTAGAARIRVADDGSGIAADLLPHVFDRFRQGEGDTRRRHGGLGLGLSIAKHIVETHGGTVHAASPGPGRGATFTVDLPGPPARSPAADLPTAAPATGPPPPDGPPVHLHGLRVLVVEDEVDTRRMLARVLGDAGAAVTPVGSVAEAMEVINAGLPHLVLSDIAMPDRDGYDLIRQVRAAGHSARELPAVALTAAAHPDDRVRALLAGFQVHVPKPVIPRELVAVLATLAGRMG